jgi:peptidyl-prolyl cis-trans isomerase D
MFDFFRRHTRALQFVLVLLVFPSFIVFGIQGYTRFMGGQNATVAKVAGQSITQAEWDLAMREQLDRAQRQMPGLDPKVFESPEMKRASLEALVREHVLLAAADKLHLTVPDERLQRLFVSDPQFAPLRNPDGSLNKDAINARGMSSELFAQRLRQDLAQRQVLLGVASSAVAPVADTAAAFDAIYQQREIQVERFSAKDYVAKANPTDAEIEAWYKDPAHAAFSQAPEQASAEYVSLDLEALKKDIKVPEDELRKYYAENAQRYTAPEERRASHILVKADKSASAADREKAKAKAETLLAEVRKSPTSFAEVAKKNSDDPGSAEKGGDLDWFSRGAMVKPFEDTAFTLKQGEISNVVQTDFGYHIITVTGVRGGDKRPFEAVRGEIENEIKTQLAQKRFAEAAVDFQNVVYEQSESLKPAADRFHLTIVTVPNVRRSPVPGTPGPLGSAKFLDALFSADSIKSKRNTEAIEFGPSAMASGRILSYSPARQLPLADVRDRVRAQVVQAQAAALARKAGEARLAAAKAAPSMEIAASAATVSRATPRETPRELLGAVMKAPASPLPQFVGVDLGPQGYAIAKVVKVGGRDPVAADQSQAQSQYAAAWGDAETQAYYEALQRRFDVRIEGSPPASATGDASR